MCVCMCELCVCMCELCVCMCELCVCMCELCVCMCELCVCMCELCVCVCMCELCTCVCVCLKALIAGSQAISYIMLRVNLYVHGSPAHTHSLTHTHTHTHTVLQVFMYKRLRNLRDTSNETDWLTPNSSQTTLETATHPPINNSVTTEPNEYTQTNPTESVNAPPCNCLVQNQPPTKVKRNLTEGDTTSPAIFVVTPTYTRYTQRTDLISVCHTLMLVPNVVWIVIEDSHYKTNSMSQLLNRCEVQSVHLNAVTPRKAIKNKKPLQHRLKGVVQRNVGLQWLRSHYRAGNCTPGVVYFADDDNRYDLRLFQEVRN